MKPPLIDMLDKTKPMPNWVVRISRLCRVECRECHWKGRRTVGFMEGVNDNHTADEMQEKLLATANNQKSKWLELCPKCGICGVKFIGVPNVKAKAKRAKVNKA